MPTVTLGQTGITTDKNGFGALPIQRIPQAEAIRILQKAYAHGIIFFDTARSYTDSEEKIGLALAKNRPNLFIATKTPAQNAEGFWKDLETSLRLMKTDYIDIYQFHNPSFCPKPGGPDGLYDAMTAAKRQGKVRFIGITNHRLPVAAEAVKSRLYDTLQFPLSYLSTGRDERLATLCAEANMGFLAMKALSGGLITDAAAAYAYLTRFAHVLPIWGVQKETELDEFLHFIKEPPCLTPEMEARIERDRRELSGSFCRGCAYCMPCPAGIEINTCARISLLLRRSPSAQWLEESWQKKMRLIEDCVECGRCRKNCPYELDTPALLKANLKDYQEILDGKQL